MAWYSLVLKTAFITRKLTCSLVLLKFQVLWIMNEWTAQTAQGPGHSAIYRTLNLSSSWKKSDAEPCHDSLILLFLAGRFHCGGFQTQLSKSYHCYFLTFRGHFLCFLIQTGIDLWWFPDMLCHALSSGCWFLTDSDLLTGIKIVKNSGVCRTERLLPHNVKCHLFRFFLSNGLCAVEQVLFLPLVSR